MPSTSTVLGLSLLAGAAEAGFLGDAGGVPVGEGRGRAGAVNAGEAAPPADRGVRALRAGAVAADAPPRRPLLPRTRQAGRGDGAAEAEPDRRVLRVPGAAVWRGGRPP